MEILIEKLDDQGRGICFIDNKITFVENALPNELVLINIYNSKKKYNEASVIKYLKKSDKREDNICPYYNKCGGCNILHLCYDEQLIYKKNKVQNIMKKFANIDKQIEIIPSVNQFNYRNKITLKIDNNKIGYYEKKSNKLVSIDKCLLVSEKLNNILNDIKKFNLKNINEIMIRNINSTNSALTLYLQNDTDCRQFEEYCKKNSIILNKIIKNNPFKISNDGKILANLGIFKFIISPFSFFQVNTYQTEKLYNQVVNFLNPKSTDIVLDLYCGTGTIGIYISKYVKKVLGVEIIKDAIKDADYNKKINNINNIEFICGDTEKIINNINESFDSIIVDPPRAGLTPNVINDIKRINPKKIVYVSCDPITLARDLKLLNDSYIVKDMILVDMFPNTYHVETVVLLDNE